MNDSSFQQMAENSALLLALVVIWDLTASRGQIKPMALRRALLGVIIGAVGIAVMLTPWQAAPGVVFDARSVLLSVSGLFFGALPTAVAMALTAAYRLYEGGAGAWTGVSVILVTGTAGIVWRRLRRRPLADISLGELYLFGFVVHLGMLALMLTLPWTLATHILAEITLPVLVLYPLATVALGALIANRLRRERAMAALQEREERFREISSAITDVAYACSQLPDGSYALTWLTGATARVSGYTAEQIMAFGCWGQLVLAEDRPTFEQNVTGLAPGATGECELRLRRRDGDVVWVNAQARCVAGLDDLGRPQPCIYGALTDITARKLATEALQKSEEDYRQLFEQAANGIFIADANGHFVEVNSSGCELLGYGRAEILRLALSDLIVDEAQAAALLALSELPAGAKMVSERRLRRKDGTPIDVELNMQILPDGRLQGVARDITARKAAEAETQAAQGELRQMLDMAGKSRQALLSVVEDQKQTEEALQRQNAYLKALQETTLDLISQLDLYTLFENIVKRAGQLTGASSGFLDLVEPATGQLKPRIGLGALAESLHFRVEPGQGVAGIVWQTGKPLLINDYDNWPLRVNDFSRGTLQAVLGVPLLSGDQVLGVLGLAHDCHTGRTFDPESLELLGQFARLAAIAIENARLFEAAQQELAERTRVELQIRTLNAELESRVRDRTAQLQATNQELEAFAYSVSHDLRAPLRAMDGFSAALLTQYGDALDDQGRHYLERIQEASQRMGQLINDLLNLSRVTRAEFTRRPVDLAALASEIAAELQQRDALRQTQFRIADQLAVQGDAALLRIALRNLLENAWKFTGNRPETRIEVGLAEDHLAPGGAADAASPAPGARFKAPIYFVRDNGVGFDMAYAAKLFVPFQRLHAMHEFPGTGIGLVTVQRIITRHGGRIWTEAAVDRGATFYFTLAPDREGTALDSMPSLS